HIEEARMDDVKAFFKKYYTPQNAVMVVAGDVDTQEVKRLAEKWFGNIPKGESFVRDLPAEPVQTEPRREEVVAEVPADSIYVAFHGPDRLSDDYQTMDLISDILSRGSSSRLYRSLIKDQRLFSEINAYVLGSIDPNLFVVEGKPLPHVALEEAEQAIWKQLDEVCTTMVSEEELQKVKNKIESTMLFAELSILDKAMNLAYYETISRAEDYNKEVEKYLAVTPQQIQNMAQYLFRKENSSTLIYKAKGGPHVE